MDALTMLDDLGGYSSDEEMSSKPWLNSSSKRWWKSTAAQDRQPPWRLRAAYVRHSSLECVRKDYVKAMMIRPPKNFYL
uniref:Uncharacterized protein n=1 Tax=Ditylenchus dipsaci TaxID=166011 RepID=A0A915DZ15_9BILA